MDNCLLAVDGMAGALLDDIEPGSEVKAVTQPDASLLVTKPPLSNLSQARIESAQGSLSNVNLGDVGSAVNSVNLQVKHIKLYNSPRNRCTTREHSYLTQHSFL